MAGFEPNGGYNYHWSVLKPAEMRFRFKVCTTKWPSHIAMIMGYSRRSVTAPKPMLARTTELPGIQHSGNTGGKIHEKDWRFYSGRWIVWQKWRKVRFRVSFILRHSEYRPSLSIWSDYLDKGVGFVQERFVRARPQNENRISVFCGGFIWAPSHLLSPFGNCTRRLQRHTRNAISTILILQEGGYKISHNLFWRNCITCAGHRIQFGDRIKPVATSAKVKVWCRSQNPLLRSKWRMIHHGGSIMWAPLQNASIDDYHRWSLPYAIRTWEELCTVLGALELKHDVFILPFSATQLGCFKFVSSRAREQ